MKIKSTGTSTSWTDSRSESRAWIGDLCGPQRSGGVGGGQVEHIVIASPPKVLRGAERQLSSALRPAASILTDTYVCVCVFAVPSQHTGVCLCEYPSANLFTASTYPFHSFIHLSRLATVLLLRNTHARTHINVSFAFVVR